MPEVLSLETEEPTPVIIASPGYGLGRLMLRAALERPDISVVGVAIDREAGYGRVELIDTVTHDSYYGRPNYQVRTSPAGITLDGVHEIPVWYIDQDEPVDRQRHEVLVTPVVRSVDLSDSSYGSGTPLMVTTDPRSETDESFRRSDVRTFFQGSDLLGERQLVYRQRFAPEPIVNITAAIYRALEVKNLAVRSIAVTEIRNVDDGQALVDQGREGVTDARKVIASQRNTVAQNDANSETLQRVFPKIRPRFRSYSVPLTMGTVASFDVGFASSVFSGATVVNALNEGTHLVDDQEIVSSGDVLGDPGIGRFNSRRIQSNGYNISFDVWYDRNWSRVNQALNAARHLSQLTLAK